MTFVVELNLFRTVVNETKIENRIGDAIVHRIIKAHHDRTPWKCCIVIPLLPGFSFPVDHSDASAVRMNGFFSLSFVDQDPRSVLSWSAKTKPSVEGQIPSSHGSGKRGST